MTKPQIWVAAFLAAFILLFMLQRATKKEEAPSRDLSSQMNNQMTDESTAELSGQQLISNFGCTNCHGGDLAGTNLAPALNNLTQHWGKESLISYLRNPNKFMDQDRFIEYKKKYPNQIMPSYGNKDIKDLGKIVDYLLAQ
jgi:cytochrome c2